MKPIILLILLALGLALVMNCEQNQQPNESVWNMMMRNGEMQNAEFGAYQLQWTQHDDSVHIVLPDYKNIDMAFAVIQFQDYKRGGLINLLTGDICVNDTSAILKVETYILWKKQ